MYVSTAAAYHNHHRKVNGMRRFVLCILLVLALAVPAQAQPIKWVDFNVPYASLKYAMDKDIETF